MICNWWHWYGLVKGHIYIYTLWGYICCLVWSCLINFICMRLFLFTFAIHFYWCTRLIMRLQTGLRVLQECILLINFELLILLLTSDLIYKITIHVHVDSQIAYLTIWLMSYFTKYSSLNMVICGLILYIFTLNNYIVTLFNYLITFVTIIEIVTLTQSIISLIFRIVSFGYTFPYLTVVIYAIIRHILVHDISRIHIR